ncbi:Cytochrome c, class I [Sulfurimonas denitrificans DSM 1251]|jgi:cytochrome c553|uniref:Cytochrome c, class I n=1 Tax=Sulfurimonas denitrificans (strain ATCC 33889 / DSM 1251) TaxID=326298 RepID=Q30SL1_SULDN|nr:c-type cytochrome [Sulfurimonas denitrificans]ABB44020.1 Cytochrome c, class I [Sulfurimonas denitrificans DSM 1251]MDD3443150.1 c-type cytochrome [Sulfurimonas denitrificans]
MIRVILFTALTLFMVGCSDDATKSSKTEVKAAVAEVKQEAKEVLKETKEAAQEIKESVKEDVKEGVVGIKAVVEEAKASATEVIEEKKAQVEEAIATATTVDAASLYKVCAGCHGVDGSKSALNKSQIIKGWDAKKLSDALHGYKNGTYGGAMKGLMGAQVSKLGDAEIEALSTYISKL